MSELHLSDWLAVCPNPCFLSLPTHLCTFPHNIYYFLPYMNIFHSIASPPTPPVPPSTHWALLHASPPFDQNSMYPKLFIVAAVTHESQPLWKRRLKLALWAPHWWHLSSATFESRKHSNRCYMEELQTISCPYTTGIGEDASFI